MIFDPEEYENNKKRYLQAFLEADDEGRKENPESQSYVLLYEAELARRSGLSRQMVSRISDEYEGDGLIVYLCDDGEDGRQCQINGDGITLAEKFRYDKSWLAKRRKVKTVATGATKEVSKSIWSNVASGIGGWIAGAVMGYQGKPVIDWLRHWLDL